MNEGLPIVLVPGLNCSARIFAEQLPALWQHGPVMIADHRHGDSVASIARSILASAPPKFALLGYSMGGYIVFEMLRQARERVTRLAFISTGARPDSEQHIKFRTERIAQIRAGNFGEMNESQFPLLVHPSRHNDERIRRTYLTMTEESGPDTLIRHLTACINRPDSRPELAAIHCPTLVLVGDSDKVTPPMFAEEIKTGVPHSRFVLVPECGHLSPLEKSDVVTESLVEWLKGSIRM